MSALISTKAMDWIPPRIMDFRCMIDVMNAIVKEVLEPLMYVCFNIPFCTTTIKQKDQQQ